MTASDSAAILREVLSVPMKLQLKSLKEKIVQIHRMVAALGAELKSLERVEYAGLTTRGLDRGGMRALAPREVRMLLRSVGMKDGTDI